MTKELRALLQQLDNAKQEVRSLMADEKMDEAKAKMEEVRAIQAKVDLQRELEETEARGLGGKELNDDGNVEERDMQELEKEYTGIVLRGIRRQRISEEMRSVISEYERRAVMNEGNTNPAIGDGDVGIVVPQDIQTRINTLMRDWNDLSQYVTVENVSALSGSRVLETDADMTPFADVDEYGVIQATDNPKFTPISYKVKKRAGYLPLTNELLADNDANLLGYVTNWIARKAAHTRNVHILAKLQTLTPKALADLKAINAVLNVDLDPAISRSAVLLTNQDGFNWLDNQVDGMGRPILNDDITQPGRKLFKGRPIAVVSNRNLPNDTTTGNAPLFIGNLKQFMVLFNRRFFELASTREGGDAWRRDTTELRTIMRDDYVQWDAAAAVYGQLDITPTP
ncbi:phage major capsid protein [Brevibacillus agri]|uniref:phage major capsid protein n=1 Tax=Brevibacillus agri TaxID=51101 RepID=UPI002E1F9A00|nr:phage major capsid protein [Brevibacillus agri]MED1642272.1 phage major capsid protein [Brevibacillus agri]MED1652595.1 phage major capsid protein [Brevibacillus agri]MED1689651.1 phage major capsid protein [Brevibacillus agri]MED1691111.1 phage major capsid protein [Brevibacillus agri]MED1696779.1 phage major capsid protein [Brevibacillus agri]